MVHTHWRNEFLGQAPLLRSSHDILIAFAKHLSPSLPVPKSSSILIVQRDFEWRLCHLSWSLGQQLSGSLVKRF